jgi:outer membrane protein assembly factor BamB
MRDNERISETVFKRFIFVTILKSVIWVSTLVLTFLLNPVFTDHAAAGGGVQKWAFSTGDDVNSSPAIGADGTIYVGSRDDSLYALREVDGVIPGIQILLLND